MTRDEKRKQQAVAGYRQAALLCRLDGDAINALRFETWATIVEQSAWQPAVVKSLISQRLTRYK